MAEIAKGAGYTPVDYINSTPVPAVSLASRQPPATCQITGLLTGETIAAGDAVYIKKSDGRLYRSSGAAAGDAATVDGFAAESCNIGEALTVFFHVHLNYSPGALVAGTSYYLSGTILGGIADAPSTAGTQVIARSIDASRVYIRKSY